MYIKWFTNKKLNFTLCASIYIEFSSFTQLNVFTFSKHTVTIKIIKTPMQSRCNCNISIASAACSEYIKQEQFKCLNITQNATFNDYFKITQPP